MSDNPYSDFDEAAKGAEGLSNRLRSTLVTKMVISFKEGPSLATISKVSSWFSKKYKRLVKKNSVEFDRQIKVLLKKGLASELTDRELNRLLFQKSVMLDDMAVIGRRMRRDIKSKLVNVISGDVSFARAVKDLKRVYPGFSQHTGTVMNSYLQRTYRSINFENQKKIGYPFYKYSGPNDSVTRDDCKKYVGKTFSAEEAEVRQAEMNTYYNCRHSWLGRWEDE